MIAISFDYSEVDAVRKKLRRTPEQLRKARHEALKIARGRLAAKIQEGFDKSRSPYGTAWAPISHRVGKPLIDTGRLRSRISSRTINNKGGGRLTFKDRTAYGYKHQQGIGVRRRVFLPDERGLPEDWQAIVRSEMRKKLGDVLAKAAVI